MYVEISPRQSGKTKRLIQAASDYLRHNPTHNIAVVSPRSNASKDLENRFIRENINIRKIKFLSGNLFGEYNQEPDYWFFDEFAYINVGNILHPIHSSVIQNAYYCTTPGCTHTTNTNTTDVIVNYCTRNGIQIHFNNPWTESRIQNIIGWDGYVREAVLGDWVRYMETNGLFNGIKINLIRKEIRKHRFTSW